MNPHETRPTGRAPDLLGLTDENGESAKLARITAVAATGAIAFGRKDNAGVQVASATLSIMEEAHLQDHLHGGGPNIIVRMTKAMGPCVVMTDGTPDGTTLATLEDMALALAFTLGTEFYEQLGTTEQALRAYASDIVVPGSFFT